MKNREACDGAIAGQHRPSFTEALRLSRTLAILAEFDARVAGTLPLGVATPNSDIDVLCHVDDPDRFVATLWQEFAEYPEFALRQWRRNDRPVIASFCAYGWPIEVFGQAVPVDNQTAWHHFSVEKRLLALGGERFRDAVIARRKSGAKTEAAFAAVLGLAGDPYQAILDIAAFEDDALLELIKQFGAKT